MELLGLPTEIFQDILHQAIVARGIKRGVRLRLVNNVMQALYTFRLLDSVHSLYDKRRPPRLSKAVLISYIGHRVMHEPANGNPLLNCLRRLAEDIHDRQNVDDRELSTVETCLDKLCSPWAVSWTFSPLKLFEKILKRESKVNEDEYRNHLFAAGLCTNNLSIVQQYMLDKDNLRDDNLLFGRYNTLAARYSGKEVLEYLLTTGVPTVNRTLRIGLFLDASEAGRADIVRFLYNFKREEVPWDFNRLKPNGYYSSEANILYMALNTPSLEVATFLGELRRRCPIRDEGKIDGMTVQLRVYRSIEAGHLDTLTYLINLGAHAQGVTHHGPNARGNDPIRIASKLGHTAIVEFLLAHGADAQAAITIAVEYGHTELVQKLLQMGLTPIDTLSNAAAGGYLDIVRLLLDAGADANESIGPMEHTAIFNLLIERGADLHSKGTTEECIERAWKDGLESMLVLLKEHGVDVKDTGST
ncbi:ankyrin repeat-containing domain protein [Massariosphaeria phaeospora]|uniref:Ankyrin repeat-containing domain protein n=1 Tax=Massariosphaeria phaeospora TaxID=100035 RepID=A0A7C8I0C9_9PLEO|nr:ankyrin repeat-containing domain protein [Massariosphaeria phaeospora]